MGITGMLDNAFGAVKSKGLGALRVASRNMYDGGRRMIGDVAQNVNRNTIGRNIQSMGSRLANEGFTGIGKGIQGLGQRTYIGSQAQESVGRTVGAALKEGWRQTPPSTRGKLVAGGAIGVGGARTIGKAIAGRRRRR